MPLPAILQGAVSAIGGMKGLGGILGASLGRGLGSRVERWAQGDRAAYTGTQGGAPQQFDFRHSSQIQSQGQRYSSDQAALAFRQQAIRDARYRNWQSAENALQRLHAEKMARIYVSANGQPGQGERTQEKSWWDTFRDYRAPTTPTQYNRSSPELALDRFGGD